MHYTGNNGDSAENNGKYFANNTVYASAHRFVDDSTVVQSVPDNYISYSVGGSKYNNCSSTGGGKYYKKCTNANSISVELCDTVKDGKVYPSEKTIKNALKLVKNLMEKYNVPRSRVIRHFDVNGKSCPAYWCGTEEKDALWKTEFWSKLPKNTTSTKTATTTTTDKSTYTGAFPVLPKKGFLGKKDTGAQVKRLQAFLNWYRDFNLKIDGEFGAATLAAVKTFQKKENLSADGYFGQESLAQAKKVKK